MKGRQRFAQLKPVFVEKKLPAYTLPGSAASSKLRPSPWSIGRHAGSISFKSKFLAILEIWAQKSGKISVPLWLTSLSHEARKINIFNADEILAKDRWSGSVFLTQPTLIAAFADDRGGRRTRGSLLAQGGHRIETRTTVRRHEARCNRNGRQSRCSHQQRQRIVRREPEKE